MTPNRLLNLTSFEIKFGVELALNRLRLEGWGVPQCP